MEYRLPVLEDKELLRSYIEEHYSRNERSLSASHMLTSMKFEDWVEKINRNVNIPDPDWGRSLTYLVFDNNVLIGLLSIRFDLDNKMANEYGHIGYGVRPTKRNKGYATKMLAFALEECKRLGLDSVILGCYKDNIGSSKTIIKNGGVLIREEDDYSRSNEYWELNLVNLFYKINLK